MKSESNAYSLLYQIFKFNLFKEQTVIVCKNEDNAIKVSLFLENAGFDFQNKVITKSNPIEYKNYHISLFNNKSARVLVTDLKCMEEMQD